MGFDCVVISFAALDREVIKTLNGDVVNPAAFVGYIFNGWRGWGGRKWVAGGDLGGV